jgi:hypothetical protein
MSYSFFIDRDPKLFRFVLSFLRDGKLPDMQNLDVRVLRQEFDFFGIPFPAEVSFLFKTKGG